MLLLPSLPFPKTKTSTASRFLYCIFSLPFSSIPILSPDLFPFTFPPYPSSTLIHTHLFLPFATFLPLYRLHYLPSLWCIGLVFNLIRLGWCTAMPSVSQPYKHKSQSHSYPPHSLVSNERFILLYKRYYFFSSNWFKYILHSLNVILLPPSPTLFILLPSPCLSSFPLFPLVYSSPLSLQSLAPIPRPTLLCTIARGEIKWMDYPGRV